MSREYTSRVWQNKELKGGKLLIMLALADHADAAGECWPGMPLLIEKTRLTDRQIRRVLNLLEKSGQIVIEERAIGRSKKPHYKLFPVEKAEIMSAFSGIADILSQESGNNVRLNDTEEIKADIYDNKSGHLVHGKADICDTDYSHVRRESPLEPTTEPQGDEEDPQARDPVALAWLENYGEPIPENLKIRIDALAGECGQGAVVYGIKASVEAKSRNFRYIAQCARNYVPAAMNGHTNGYAVELPGGYRLQPPEQPVQAAPLLPPMAHDDPWAVALAELRPNLPGVAESYLTGSRMEAAGDVEGVPRYRIVVEARAAAGVDWLNKQVSTNIRRTLGSILRQKIAIEIVAEQEAITA